MDYNHLFCNFRDTVMPVYYHVIYASIIGYDVGALFAG